MKVGDLVRLSQLQDADAETFEMYRREAIAEAQVVFVDRAESYNVSHEPYREMPFGIVSLVSELYKRIIRLTSLVTPMRKEDLRKEDLERIIDTMTDSINYASWGYAMTKIALEKLEKEDNGDRETRGLDGGRNE